MHGVEPGWSSVLLGLGVLPRTVMEIAGHSALEMTIERLRPRDAGRQTQTLDKLSDLFEEGQK